MKILKNGTKVVFLEMKPKWAKRAHITINIREEDYYFSKIQSSQ